jgi:hypothetical protein
MKHINIILIIAIISLGHVAAAASFGPFPGWTAKAYHDSGRLLWQHDSGKASLWTVADGQYVGHRDYGPYTDWTAQDAGPGYLLWSDAAGLASLWTLDDSNQFTGHRYYAPHAGWTAVSYTEVPGDGARMLWASSGG